MLYIPKIDDFLKIWIDKELKDFVAINFIEYLNLQKKNYILN